MENQETRIAFGIHDLITTELYAREAMPLAQGIIKHAKSIVFDPNTRKGQKQGRSVVDKMRTHKADFKRSKDKGLLTTRATISATNEEWKKIEADMNEAIKYILAPVIEAEEKEEIRVATIRDKINQFYLAMNHDWETSHLATGALEEVMDIEIDDSLQEFKKHAFLKKEEAIKVLEERIAALKKTEADNAELEKLRDEKKARDDEELRVNEIKGKIANLFIQVRNVDFDGDIDGVKRAIGHVYDVDCDDGFDELREEAKEARGTTLSLLNSEFKRLEAVEANANETRQRERIKIMIHDPAHYEYESSSDIGYVIRVTKSLLSDSIETFAPLVKEATDSANESIKLLQGKYDILKAKEDKRIADDAAQAEHERLEEAAKIKQEKADADAKALAEKEAKRISDEQHRSKIESNLIESLTSGLAWMTETRAHDLVVRISKEKYENLTINY